MGKNFPALKLQQTWQPYQTCLLYLDDMIDYHHFLAGRFGTFKIEMPTKGVFPRLIGGCERNGVWSIDHTNFAATDGAAAADIFEVDRNEPAKSLVFAVPNNVDANWKCFADVYPTFPSGTEYEVEVTKVAANGARSCIDAIPFSQKRVGDLNV